MSCASTAHGTQHYVTSFSQSEGACACLSNRVILLSRATAHSNSTHNLSVLLQWDAAGKDHDLAAIRCMNAEELIPRLRVRGQILGRYIEGARSVSLLDGYIDAADPRAIHADMCDQ